MRAAIVRDGIIINVVVLPDAADPACFGAVPLPDGKWIGDPIDDAHTPDLTVWDELDAAYREGVARAYDQ